MAVFRGGVNLDFSSIINGLRNVGRAAASITRIAVPATRLPMPKTNMDSLMSRVQQLQQLVNATGKFAPRFAAVPKVTATMPKAFLPQFAKPLMTMGGFPKAVIPSLTNQFERLGKAFDAKDFEKFKDAFSQIRRRMQAGMPPEVWKQTGKALAHMYRQLHAHAKAVNKNTSLENATINAKKRLQKRIDEMSVAMRKQVTAGIWGRVPVVGGIMGMVGGYRTQRAQMQGMFGTLAEAGAPVGRMTRMVSALTLAAGPIGVIAKTVKEAAGFFVRLTGATIRFGVSLAKLPLKVFSFMHRTLQSLTFSFLMFAHMFQRFFKDAFEIMKNLHVATLVASGTFKGLTENLAFAVKIGSKYAMSLRDISQGFVQVAKAGYDAAEQQEIVNAAVQGATSLQANLSRTIDVTLTILKAWDLEANKSIEVVGVLRTAVETTKSTWEGMATALGYGAAASASLNANFIDTVSIIAQFMDKGLRASRAGMAFRTMIAGIDKAIGHATEGQMNLDQAIEILGVDWQKYANQMTKGSLDIIAVVEDLARVTEDGISSQERLALLQVFGRRYYSQIILLLKDADGALSDFTQTLKVSIDLEERAAKMSSSLIGVIIRLKNIWMTFKIYVLEGMRGPLEGMSDGLDRMLGLAERTGKAIGELLKSTLVRPAVDWFSEMTSPERIGDFGKKINVFVRQIGHWFGRIRDAVGRWIETVTGKAQEGAGGLINDFCLLLEKSIDISAIVTRTFFKIAGEGDKIIRIIDKVSYLVETLFPPFLELVIDVVLAVLKAIDAIPGITVPGIEDIAVQMQKIKDLSSGVGEGILEGFSAGDDRAKEWLETWRTARAEYAVAERDAAGAGRSSMVGAGLSLISPLAMAIFGPDALTAQQRASDRLEEAGIVLERAGRGFAAYVDRLPEIEAKAAAAAMNRE